MLQTIQKVGDVLDLFGTAHREWTLGQIADQIGVPRSSAHALLSSIVETGLLEVCGRARYRIGWRVIQLSEAHRRSRDLALVAEPYLRDLALAQGEIAHLAVLERTRVTYVCRAPGRHRVGVTVPPVGVAFDAHGSAVGKVLLAHRDPAEIERLVLSRPLRRYTRATIVRPDILVDHLASIRAAGTAVDAGEMLAEVCCLAAPVRDDLGVVVAALGVTLPATRFAGCTAQLSDAVTTTAHRLSAELPHCGREAPTDGVTGAAGAASVPPSHVRAAPRSPVH